VTAKTKIIIVVTILAILAITEGRGRRKRINRLVDRKYYDKYKLKISTLYILLH